MALGNAEKGAACGCGCGLLVAFFIVLMCSFSTLSPREYGVTYNDWVKSVERNHVTAGGRNLIGPQKTYIKFPRGLVGFFFNDVGAGTDTAESWASWMDWSRLSVWSSNGQIVNIGLSMNLQLREEAVNSMYMRYGTDPWSTVRVTLVATIKNVCVEYSTLDFFLKRTKIKDRLMERIEAALDADGAFKLLMLNLRSIDLPYEFEQTILDKLLAYQAYQKAVYQQGVNKAEKVIEEVVASGEAIALVSLVEARALGDLEIVRPQQPCPRGEPPATTLERRNRHNTIT
jgi:hypothetical protein